MLTVRRTTLNKLGSPLGPGRFLHIGSSLAHQVAMAYQVLYFLRAIAAVAELDIAFGDLIAVSRGGRFEVIRRSQADSSVLYRPLLDGRLILETDREGAPPTHPAGEGWPHLRLLK